jgi:hypothetical protein
MSIMQRQIIILLWSTVLDLRGHLNHLIALYTTAGITTYANRVLVISSRKDRGRGGREGGRGMPVCMLKNLHKIFLIQLHTVMG